MGLSLLKLLTGVATSSTGILNVNGKVSALLELGAGFNSEYSGVDNIYLNGTIMGIPREEMEKPILHSEVLEIKDLKEGMILKGTVRNIVDFGAFVDIGVHQDGLVHISQLSERYIKHPLDVVSVGDIVEVKVINIDVERQKIGLSMKI